MDHRPEPANAPNNQLENDNKDATSPNNNMEGIGSANITSKFAGLSLNQPQPPFRPPFSSLPPDAPNAFNMNAVPPSHRIVPGTSLPPRGPTHISTAQANIASDNRVTLPTFTGPNSISSRSSPLLNGQSLQSTPGIIDTLSEPSSRQHSPSPTIGRTTEKIIESIPKVASEPLISSNEEFVQQTCHSPASNSEENLLGDLNDAPGMSSGKGSSGIHTGGSGSSQSLDATKQISPNLGLEDATLTKISPPIAPTVGGANVNARLTMQSSSDSSLTGGSSNLEGEAAILDASSGCKLNQNEPVCNASSHPGESLFESQNVSSQSENAILNQDPSVSLTNQQTSENSAPISTSNSPRIGISQLHSKRYVRPDQQSLLPGGFQSPHGPGAYPSTFSVPSGSYQPLHGPRPGNSYGTPMMTPPLPSMGLPPAPPTASEMAASKGPPLSDPPSVVNPLHTSKKYPSASPNFQPNFGSHSPFGGPSSMVGQPAPSFTPMPAMPQSYISNQQSYGSFSPLAPSQQMTASHLPPTSFHSPIALPLAASTLPSASLGPPPKAMGIQSTPQANSNVQPPLSTFSSPAFSTSSTALGSPAFSFSPSAVGAPSLVNNPPGVNMTPSSLGNQRFGPPQPAPLGPQPISSVGPLSGPLRPLGPVLGPSMPQTGPLSGYLGQPQTSIGPPPKSFNLAPATVGATPKSISPSLSHLGQPSSSFVPPPTSIGPPPVSFAPNVASTGQSQSQSFSGASASVVNASPPLSSSNLHEQPKDLPPQPPVSSSSSSSAEPHNTSPSNLVPSSVINSEASSSVDVLPRSYPNSSKSTANSTDPSVNVSSVSSTHTAASISPPTQVQSQSSSSIEKQSLTMVSRPQTSTEAHNSSLPPTAGPTAPSIVPPQSSASLGPAGMISTPSSSFGPQSSIVPQPPTSFAPQSTMIPQSTMVPPPPASFGPQSAMVPPPPTSFGPQSAMVPPPPTSFGSQSAMVPPPPTSFGPQSTMVPHPPASFGQQPPIVSPPLPPTSFGLPRPSMVPPPRTSFGPPPTAMIPPPRAMVPTPATSSFGPPPMTMVPSGAHPSMKPSASMGSLQISVGSPGLYNPATSLHAPPASIGPPNPSMHLTPTLRQPMPANIPPPTSFGAPPTSIAPPPKTMGAPQPGAPITTPPAPSQPGIFPSSANSSMYPNRSYSSPSLHSEQLSQNMGGLSVTHQGWNKGWGTDPVDLLQHRVVLPPEGIVPPKPLLAQPYLPNCSPDIFRCTFTKAPESQSILQKSRLPFGILIHPFKDLEHLAVVSCNTIVRCRSCRTYINPFVCFKSDRRWECNLCFRVNDLPDEFQYDPISRTFGDPSRRPEVKEATIEFIAPGEYMLRPPQQAAYLYVLEVSRQAIDTGYLQVVCDTLLNSLDKIPGDRRTQIGFITFADTLQFYLMDGSGKVQMLEVGDVNDIFLPCPQDLLVNLEECFSSVEDLLTTLPETHAKTIRGHSALGPALTAAYKLMAPIGGRVTVMAVTLPSVGPGALKPREDPNQRAAKEISHLGPATDFYKRLALDCSGQQIAVDLFTFNSQYIDLATLSGISKFSGGSINHFPGFHLSSNLPLVESFKSCFTRYITRKIGLEAVMRIRATRGIVISNFHGNFFVRSTDLLSLPNINPDAAFGMQVTIDEPLHNIRYACFQAALLYTSSRGERRIRVHTLCLPISPNVHEVVNSADQQAIVALLAKMAVDRCFMSQMSDAREAVVNACTDALSSYKLFLSSFVGLPCPQNLKLLPLYCLALLKSVALRHGTSTKLDDRIFAMCELKTLPLRFLMTTIYPDLYAIHNLSEEGAINIEDIIIPQPARLQLSSEFIDRNGAFLMDVGSVMYLYVRSGVSVEWIVQVLDVPSFAAIPQPLYKNPFPVLDNRASELVRNFVGYLQQNKPYAVPILVIREDNPSRSLFIQNLLDDRCEGSHSYVEFIQYIKSQVK